MLTLLLLRDAASEAVGQSTSYIDGQTDRDEQINCTSCINCACVRGAETTSWLVVAPLVRLIV